MQTATAHGHESNTSQKEAFSGSQHMDESLSGSQNIRASVDQSAKSTVSQTAASALHADATSSHKSAHTASASFKGVGLGGAIFAKSLLSGGSFANDVIGTVAKGDLRSTGSITGELAAQSLQSYLGYTAGSTADKEPPTFSNVEIGGGRITGMVSRPGWSEPLSFGMYDAEQYVEPKGEFSRVRSEDGTLWYAQLAQDAVDRKPYKAPDDTIAYQESIVKKLPDPPRRKDKI